jgi:hypothetical protein
VRRLDRTGRRGPHDRDRHHDADWRHGTGPEVSGPAIALVMAMTGRKAALDDLTGDGVAVLRERS